MNRRKFLKALFCIPLLAVVPKMEVEERKDIWYSTGKGTWIPEFDNKLTGQQADITVLDDYKKYVFPELSPSVDFWSTNGLKLVDNNNNEIPLDDYIWPTDGPDFKWSYDTCHPDEELYKLLQEVDCTIYDLVNNTDNPECKFEGLAKYVNVKL